MSLIMILINYSRVPFQALVAYNAFANFFCFIPQSDNNGITKYKVTVCQMNQLIHALLVVCHVFS